MMVTFSIFGVLQLLVLYPVHLEAQILFRGNITSYWPHGSLVKLPWEIKFPSSDIGYVIWWFTRSGSNQTEMLAFQSSMTRAPFIRDPTFSIIDRATLVFQNATSNHSGTYTLAVTLLDFAGGKKSSSSVVVIILVKPTDISFTSDMVNNFAIIDEDITLTCNTKGNPKPNYQIVFNGTILEDSEDGIVVIKNVNCDNNGTYVCVANNTQGELQASLNVITAKPEITSLKSAELGNGRIIHTCEASQRIPTIYYMIFRRRYLSDVKNGIKIITKVSSNTPGVYKCIAVNVIGYSSKELNITFKELEITTLPPPNKSSSTSAVVTNAPTRTSTLKNESNANSTVPGAVVTNAPTRTSTLKNESNANSTVPVTKQPTPEETSDLPVGAIVGIVIGILFAIIIPVALVYWCYFKNGDAHGIDCSTKMEDAGEDDQVVNHSVSPRGQSSRIENPDESAIKMKIKSAKRNSYFR